ncbi:MAG: carboxypeptidase regulatory-like domain-containing protein, partial [Polyangiaceae bacterium]
TDGADEDAAPIAGASVVLTEGGLSPFPLEATTDVTGRTRVGTIAHGLSTLTARANGFVARGAVEVADPPPAETLIALLRAGTLTGRVVDQHGDPIEGATIEIAGSDPSGGPIYDDPRRANFRAAHFEAMLKGPMPLVQAGELGVIPGPVPPIPNGAFVGAPLGVPVPRGPGEVDPWVTGDDGTFRASPASPGRVRAIVQSARYVEAESDTVTLVPGGEAHVEVVMHEGGALEGRVLDDSDMPVKGAFVAVSAAQGTMERMTRTASDGAFAIAGLPQAVSLTVSTEDDGQPEVRLAMTIPEGGRQEVTIHLPAARDPLAVNVVDERGDAVRMAEITASSLALDSPLRTTAFTDVQGSASLQGARGLPLRVEVRAPSHALRIVTTKGGEGPLQIELDPAETATGQVTAARGGDAIAGAEVTLYTNLGICRANTDAQGAFVLSGLSPGPARMTLRAAGFAAVAEAIKVPDSGGRRPYEITPIELTAEGIVTGDVADAQGNPVAGARVGVGQVPTWLVVGSRAARSGAWSTTDSKGRFSLREVPEGTVTLVAYAPGIGRARTAGVSVTSDRTTEGVHLIIAPAEGDGEADAGEPPVTSGGVAVTLGETAPPIEVIVVSVAAGSEAERAGIAAGDVLTSVDGAAVHGMSDARAKLSGPITNDVLVALQRGGRSIALRVVREAVHR